LLVITRKPGQSLLFGDDVELKLVEVRGMEVRVGISAPPTVPLLRKEVLTNGKTNRGRRIAELMQSSFYGAPSTGQ